MEEAAYRSLSNSRIQNINIFNGGKNKFGLIKAFFYSLCNTSPWFGYQYIDIWGKKKK